ncbi:MAG: SGNH/GDSL hydrolase family protein [Bacteroidota bacterium]
MGIRTIKIKRHILYAGYLLVITIIALEILLRFFYPFQRKIMGDKWQLATNSTYHLRNVQNRRLDRRVINRRNSIGFRGEDPPADINRRLSILTVGGSTTACTALTEGKTWTDRLGEQLRKRFTPVWINNAGLDGNSTYGHLNFLKNYLPAINFKPTVVIFLIGINEIDRDDLNEIDSPVKKGFLYNTWKWLHYNSETLNFFTDLKRSIYPTAIFTDNGGWNFTNFKKINLSGIYIDSALQKQGSLLPSFRKRLSELIEYCLKNGMQPVFVTQPLIFGDGTFGEGNPAIDFHAFNENENGVLLWKKLELFNNITRQVSREKNVCCVDLAGLMPRDTLYYYDSMHYTNEGAAKVGEIIFDKLNQYLSVKFPQYLKN